MRGGHASTYAACVGLTPKAQQKHVALFMSWDAFYVRPGAHVMMTRKCPGAADLDQEVYQGELLEH